MRTDPPSINIASTYEFQHKLRALAKKYRQISNDLQPVIARLQLGEQIGDQIPNLGGYVVFKV